VLSGTESHITVTNGPIIPIPEDKRLWSSDTHDKWKCKAESEKILPCNILSTTNPTTTVKGFENSRLLLESGEYTPDIFHDKYEY
jgi:hypothetical protein